MEMESQCAAAPSSHRLMKYPVGYVPIDPRVSSGLRKYHPGCWQLLFLTVWLSYHPRSWC